MPKMVDDESVATEWAPRIAELGRRVRAALVARMASRESEHGAVVRDGEGDTIFAIDVDAEAILLELAETWSKQTSFELVAEGLEPSGRLRFGTGEPTACVIVDPIDGTRGLMFDKRSAWCLAAVAPMREHTPRLQDLIAAHMCELPTSRQNRVDELWARRGRSAEGLRTDLSTGRSERLIPRPSTATSLRHGFATVCNFFQGGKELTARVDEELMRRALGPWNHQKAEVYVDQYISSGGQLGELALGRDRFVLDIRPLVHRALGFPDSLCSKPYDLCCALVARSAGCIVEAVDGSPLDGPLDTTTNLGFAAYANPSLAEFLRPLVRETLDRFGLWM
ncbi:MAG: inositol monophosphatase [Planctomycetota bacterium]